MPTAIDTGTQDLLASLDTPEELVQFRLQLPDSDRLRHLFCTLARPCGAMRKH